MSVYYITFIILYSLTICSYKNKQVSFSGEIEAISLALQLLYKLKAVFPNRFNTGSFFQQPIKIKEHKLHEMGPKQIQALNKTVVFQWLSSHVMFEKNRMAGRQTCTIYIKDKSLQIDSLQKLLNNIYDSITFNRKIKEAEIKYK